MKTRWIAAFLLFGASCSSESRDWSEQSAVVNRLMTAAAEQDTATVATLSTGDVRDRLATMRQLDSSLFAAAASGMEVVRGRVVSPDTSYLSFRPRSGSSQEVLDFGLVRASAGWRVYYVTVPGRM